MTLIFNEYLEAKNYFDGKDIPRQNTYRAILFVCRYMKELGMKRLEARDKLIEWKRENDVGSKYDVNQIIDFVYDYEKRSLSKAESVYVSESDILQITRRFDHKKTRLIAFIMLCYAKAFGNANREISVSYLDLSMWSGISDTTIYRSVIPELLNYDYVEIVDGSSKRFKSNEHFARRKTKYRLLVLCKNIGEYKVSDNIVAEFNRLFGYE